MCLHAAKVSFLIPFACCCLLMKQCSFLKPILVAVLGSAALSANAAESVKTNSIVVTLDAVVADALEKNPELKFYEAEIAAAKGGRKTAGLPGNPEVNGGVGEKSVRGVGLSAEGVAWSVSVVQPFEWPGRLGLRKAIANRDINLAELGYERFKVALVGRVRSLAFGLFAAQEKAAAAREVAQWPIDDTYFFGKLAIYATLSREVVPVRLQEAGVDPRGRTRGRCQPT